MDMRTIRATALAGLAGLAAASGAPAQGFVGTFTNFETPQTHPVEVVMIGGTEFVLVCNTPDNSLEVYTATSPPVFQLRVGVGLGPGTVRWNAALQRAYVCNFDGDSVSIVPLANSGGNLTGFLERTTHVGDEPADIAFHPSSAIAMVTLSSRSQIQFVDPNTLAPFGGPSRLDTTFGASNGLYGSGSEPMAVKAPRQAAWLGGDRLLVLNFMGGQELPTGAQLTPPAPKFVDLDLWRVDNAFAPGATANYLGNLGTTNHAFALNASGNTMVVVGTRAQNFDSLVMGVGKVRGLPTGFVQSWLWVVDVPPTGNMTRHAQAPAGSPAGAGNPLPSINLNRDYSSTLSPGQEVASNLAIVQPTGVDIFESGSTIQRIAVTGYHSDNIAILTPNSGAFGGYTINRASFTPTAPYTVVGPRGAEFNAAGTLLFVNGRLDNTLRAIDTTTPTTNTVVALSQDPTPNFIKSGREFLYSTRFSRGVNSSGPNTSGFVSCASCHVDGRTDGLSWDLSDFGASTVVIPPASSEIPVAAGTTFPNPKGRLITQTLQGLVDYPTNESFQFVAINAPYHWRGDRFTDASGEAFTKFNEAFVNLQGMPTLGGSGPAATGCCGAQMIDYRRFVFSIRHPANPEQALTRTVTGTVPANPNVPNPQVGPIGSASPFTGSAAGRAIYHNYLIDLALVGSCVDCHSLPDGSSNTISEIVNQPFESAALRNLFAREATVHTSTMPDPLTSLPSPTDPLKFPGTAWVLNRGLSHDGGIATFGATVGGIQNFVTNPFVFFPNYPAIVGNPTPTSTQLDDARAQADALIQFVREFDTGMAPLSGFAFTVDNTLSPLNSGANAVAFSALEGQVQQANIGFGVRARASNGTVRGFWFDPLSGYRDAQLPLAAAISRAALLTSFAGPGTVMVLQGTPLGSERRWADPSGIGQVVTSMPVRAPTNILLEEMAPDTFYEGTTQLNMAITTTAPIGTTDWRLTHFHSAVVGLGFGVPGPRRHEPPRRFRISGTDIRHGARMFLFMSDPSSPTGFTPLGMEMALAPTQFVSPANNNPIWETELELSPLQTYAFLNGGPFAPGVQATFDTTFGGTAPPLSPGTFNQYIVLVLNEDGTLSMPTTPAPLRIRDIR